MHTSLSEKPSDALCHYWNLREGIDARPAVNLLMQKKEMDRIDAEDTVRGLLQLIISHKFSQDPAVPFIMLTGPINTLYSSIRLEGTDFFRLLETRLGLKWGHYTLDGVSAPKVESSDGIQYMLNRLKVDYGTYLTRSLNLWVHEGKLGQLAPTALFWATHGDQALSQALRCRDIKSLSHRWATVQ